MTYRLSNSRKSHVAPALMRVPLMVLASQVTIGSRHCFLGGVLGNTQGDIWRLLPGQGPGRALPASAMRLGGLHLDLTRFGLLRLGQMQG
jgi:hypothetical protein